jgi:hypothetical protein
MGLSMTLYNGHRVDPFVITPDDINIQNIAHSLSMLCRFGGHTQVFYSVAQHCVRVSEALPKELQLEGLLHDATESIVQDLIRPIKRGIYGYSELENRVWSAISAKFGLRGGLSYETIQADNNALKSEIRQFMLDPGRSEELSSSYWESKEELPPVSEVWSPTVAKQKYLDAFMRLRY